MPDEIVTDAFLPEAPHLIEIAGEVRWWEGEGDPDKPLPGVPWRWRKRE